MANPNRGFIGVPGHPGIQVECVPYDDGTVRLSYVGFRDDIIGLGVVTAQTLEPWRKGQPKGKRDAQGDRIFVSRCYSVRDGVPRERFRVRSLEKTSARAMLLPGAPEALAWYRERNHIGDDVHELVAETIVSDAIERARVASKTLH